MHNPTGVDGTPPPCYNKARIFTKKEAVVTSWFVFSLCCVGAWGCADLFYKKSSDEADRFSHLKIAVWVGLVMGVCAVGLLPFSETLKNGDVSGFFHNAVCYAPASLCYILSMIIGYAGLRYLELSVVSPVQNASGALSALCMLIFFAATGKIAHIGEAFSPLDLVGTGLIVAGMIALAVTEQKLAETPDAADKHYRFGALALLFPLLYCVFDTVGTAADGILLDEEAGLGLGEIDVLVLYGLTFFAAGLVAWAVLFAKERRAYNPFAKSERPKAAAALCEEGGQVFYVYAMAAKPLLAAPMVASYCIVSVLLSRLILKEKLTRAQTACIAAVIAGIVALGVSEGLAEA